MKTEYHCRQTGEHVSNPCPCGWSDATGGMGPDFPICTCGHSSAVHDNLYRDGRDKCLMCSCVDFNKPPCESILNHPSYLNGYQSQNLRFAKMNEANDIYNVSEMDCWRSTEFR